MYVFLEEAYGPVWGFLFGWAALLVVLTGSVAGVAVGFAEYFSYFAPSLGTSRILWPAGPLTVSAGGVVAAVSILAIAAINLVGVATVNRVCRAALTIAKIAGIAAIPLLAIAFHPVTPDLSPVAASGGAPGGALSAWR